MTSPLTSVATTKRISVPVPVSDVSNSTVTIAVHASKSNTGTRPSIVFIHGNSLSSKMFASQMTDSRLSDKFDLSAIDLPGHGDSQNATEETVSTYSIDGFPAIIASAIRSLGLDPSQTIVFGHSLGGHIAIRLLSHFKLAGLAITGTPPFDNTPDFAARFVMDDPSMGILFKPEKYTQEEAEARARGQVAKDVAPPEVCYWPRAALQEVES